jgi:serine/threonine protein kinase
MLTKSGAKLLDFGLARATGLAPTAGDMASPTMSRALTAEGTIVGTFQYMAPEQLEGKEADPRSDLFSLGAVLYEMATGKRAFEGKSQASLIASILKETPQPISSITNVAPPALDRIVMRCLEKDPEDR